jgi:hypothetical protein
VVVERLLLGRVFWKAFLLFLLILLEMIAVITQFLNMQFLYSSHGNEEKKYFVDVGSMMNDAGRRPAEGIMAIACNYARKGHALLQEAKDDLLAAVAKFEILSLGSF